MTTPGTRLCIKWEQASMYHASWRLLSALAVCLAFVLQACAPAAAPSATQAAKPGGPAPTAKPQVGAEVLVPTAVPTRPAEVAKPGTGAQPGGQLNLPVPREETFVMATGPRDAITITDSFNYFTPRGIQPDWNLNAVVNEALLYHNIEGTAPEEQWVPGLAERWEYTSTEYMAWKMTLRDGIKWNDGVPFSSADVKYTVDTMIDNKALGRREGIAGIQTVEAPDPKTVIFKFAQPNPRFHQYFASRVGGLIILPKHKWQEQDPVAYKNNPPVGTGPYKLKQVLPDQKMIIFERDDNYWGKAVFGLPKPKYVTIVSPPPPDLLAEGYKTGLYDYGGGLTYSAAKQMVDESGGNAFVLPFLDMCPRAILFNHDLAPTNKVEVRQALAHMIDRKAAAATLWKPPSRVTSRPWYGGSSMLGFASPALVEKYTQMYTGDQKKALELFQQAGYKQDGGKMVDAQGQQLRIDVYTPVQPESAEHPIAIKLTDDLKKMGVDASFKAETGAAAVERRQKAEWHVQSMWQCGGNLGDAVALYQNHMSDKITAPVGQLNQGTNLSHYQNPKFDELVKKLIPIPSDDPAARPLYDELYQIWMDDMVSFPLMETIYTQIGNTSYWRNFPQQPSFHTHPANWHMTMMNLIKKLEPGRLGKAN